MKRAAIATLCLGTVLPLLGGCARRPSSVAVVRSGPAETSEMNRAVDLAVRAVEQYERRETDQALISLRLAEEVVRPAAQSQGRAPLELLSQRLPAHYRKYDLQKLRAQLESQVQAPPAGAAPSPAGTNWAARPPEAPLPGETGRPLIVEETRYAPSPGTAALPAGPAPAGYSPTLPAALRGVDPPRSVQMHAVDQQTFVRNELDRLMAEFGEHSFDPPADFVAEIHRRIAAYQSGERAFFQNALTRSVQYAPLIEKLFRKRNVPRDMIFMAFVESGFRPEAVSRSGAVGLWQFMSGTARDYGMQVGRDVDERRDPIRSTLAARDYFVDLLSIFGTRSWLLAMAAYNAGENKIAACLKTIDDPFQHRTFWHIRGCLRHETQEYVPRILAAAIVASDPRRFGFEPPRLPPQRPFETVALPGHTTISALARAAGCNRDELLDLNPDLDPRHDATPLATAAKMYRLNVPLGAGVRVQQQWAELARAGAAARPAPSPATTLAATPAASRAAGRGSGSGGGSSAKAKQEAAPYFLYTIAKGNTLAEIARVFGVGSYKEIMRWNSLRSSTAVSQQKLKIFRPFRSVTYTVRKGDTLAGIAKKFGVGMDKIRFYNGLRDNTVYAGQSLKLYVAAR
jgi:membrane-bound lytic murein transglycosylase D